MSDPDPSPGCPGRRPALHPAGVVNRCAPLRCRRFYAITISRPSMTSAAPTEACSLFCRPADKSRSFISCDPLGSRIGIPSVCPGKPGPKMHPLGQSGLPSSKCRHRSWSSACRLRRFAPPVRRALAPADRSLPDFRPTAACGSLRRSAVRDLRPVPALNLPSLHPLAVPPGGWSVLPVDRTASSVLPSVLLTGSRRRDGFGMQPRG